MALTALAFVIVMVRRLMGLLFCLVLLVLLLAGTVVVAPLLLIANWRASRKQDAK